MHIVPCILDKEIGKLLCSNAISYLIEVDNFWMMVEFEVLLPFKNVSLSKELCSIDGDFFPLNGSNKFLIIIIATHWSDIKQFSKLFWSQKVLYGQWIIWVEEMSLVLSCKIDRLFNKHFKYILILVAPHRILSVLHENQIIGHVVHNAIV